MRILSKILVCMALLLGSSSSFIALAQTASAASNPAAAFAKSLQGRLASFDYSYSMSGSLPMNGSGSVKLQGNAFTMEGNGLDIRCDGKTRWTVDVAAEECYIENIDAQELDYEANPALLVGALDRAFNYKDSSTASFNGMRVSEIRLVPKKKGSSINEVSLFLTQGNQPAGALGVIGPMRINYAKIIPYIEYFTQKLTDLISSEDDTPEDQTRQQIE